MGKKRAYTILVIISIITAAHVYFIFSLNFDYNFENFFPIGDEDLIYYQTFRENFENDNDYLLLGFKDDNGIFNQEFLIQLKKFRIALKDHPSVINIQGPTQLINPVLTAAGVFRVPLIHVGQPALYVQDSSRIFNEGKFVGTFFSNDGKAVAMLLRHTAMIENNDERGGIGNIFNLNNYCRWLFNFIYRQYKAY